MIILQESATTDFARATNNVHTDTHTSQKRWATTEVVNRLNGKSIRQKRAHAVWRMTTTTLRRPRSWLMMVSRWSVNQHVDNNNMRTVFFTGLLVLYYFSETLPHWFGLIIMIMQYPNNMIIAWTLDNFTV